MPGYGPTEMSLQVTFLRKIKIFLIQMNKQKPSTCIELYQIVCVSYQGWIVWQSIKPNQIHQSYSGAIGKGNYTDFSQFDVPDVLH